METSVISGKASLLVCLITINHEWQPCFLGHQILLTTSDSWKCKVPLKTPTYIADHSADGIQAAPVFTELHWYVSLPVYLPQSKMSHQLTLYMFCSEKAIPFYLPWIWKHTKLLKQKNKNNNKAATSSINQYSTIDVNRAMQIYTSWGWHIKSSTNFIQKKIETTAAILNTLFSYAQNGLWNKSSL